MRLLCSEHTSLAFQSSTISRSWACDLISLTAFFLRRYVAFIAGEAVVSLPDSAQKATIQGGRHGLILAADTANISTFGHITKYPSKEVTVGIQIPTAYNEIPPHTVLHEGPCVKKEENS